MRKGPAVASRSLAVWVPSQCGRSFLSGAGEDCVAAEAAAVSAAAQTFQNGLMLWRGDTREVFALYSNGSGVKTVESWTSGDITWGETPPEGSLLPQHGFGQVWTTNEGIRTSLGWATAAEQGYSAQFQTGYTPNGGSAGSPNVLYTSMADGRTLRIRFNGGSLSWSFIA